MARWRRGKPDVRPRRAYAARLLAESRWMYLASCVMLVLLFAGAGRDGEQERVVRVMTYNIHHGVGTDGVLDLGRIATVIRRHDVDIVGLQEVDRHWSERSDFADQVGVLAEQLGMHAYFAPLYDLPPGPGRSERRQYGLAVLSRYPIVEAENRSLTRLPTIGEDRSRRLLPGFPSVTVDVDGTALHVFNTHLDYRSDPAVRRTQAAEMRPHLEAARGPVVLLGDFNAPPGAPELEAVETLLVDAWAAGGTDDGFTFPAHEPVKRIDYVFTSRDLEVVSAVVPRVEASDHLPLVVALRVRTSP